MLCTRGSKYVVFAGALFLLSACQSVGPIAINQGRGSYNNRIESTAKEQTFANIIRVYHHEPTLFMDVTEVDATTTLSGSLNGGVAGIGARAGTSGGTLAGQVESIGGGATYSESPRVRYQPLLGQALVAQLTIPLSSDVLASLYDSSWGVAPLLDLATSFITLDDDEFYAALNSLIELDHNTAIELVAEKSDLTKASDKIKNAKLLHNGEANVTLEVSNKASGTGTNDALVIYLLSYHLRTTHRTTTDVRQSLILWEGLLYLYRDTQENFSTAKGVKCPANRWSIVDLAMARKCLPTSIEIRTMPTESKKARAKELVSGAPLMKTYSALGVLKNAVEQPFPKIALVSPLQYNIIRPHRWNDFKSDTNLNFYPLLPKDERPGDEKGVARSYSCSDDNITVKICTWLDRTNIPYIDGPSSPMSEDEDECVEGNERLGHLRRYLIVIVDDQPPPDAYVSHYSHGQWHYIAGDDEIPQKNFDLISPFMTMMAVPSTTSPVGTSISVGGG